MTKVCPRCFSPHVVYAAWGGSSTAQQYRCNNCGLLTGVIVDMSEKNLTELSKKKV